MSDIYTHTTSLENLTRMLDGSRHIMALRHLARTSPDTEVSVEPLPMPIRRRMKAGDAYERMRGVKDTDRVFLSHRGWLPNYGDAVVVKRLSPRLRTHYFQRRQKRISMDMEVSMSTLFYLSSAQMDVIRPFFPRSRGIPRRDDQKIISGIIHVLKFGLRWKDAPKEYGPYKTLYNRFVR